MKISSVEVLLAEEPPVTPSFNWRRGLPSSEAARTAGWLVITTDTGLRGFAYCARGRILADIVDRRIRAELLGVDPYSREWLWHRLWEIDRIETLPTYIVGVVDEALWDIAGKAAGVPVHQLMGTFRTSIPAYASTVTFGTVEEYLDVADQCLDVGYGAIKLHAWGEARADANLIERLREHVGPDVPLMYDGSAGFDLMDAVFVGDALSASGYLWYEEPMREFSVTAYKQLGERVSVPLLVAEVSAGAHMNAGDFVASGRVSALRVGSTFRGGITGSLRTAHLADAYHLRAEVHGMGLANTHLCMSIPNSTYYESLVDSNPVRRRPEVDAAGLVHAPTSPGIGNEAVWEDELPPLTGELSA